MLGSIISEMDLFYFEIIQYNLYNLPRYRVQIEKITCILKSQKKAWAYGMLKNNKNNLNC